MAVYDRENCAGPKQIQAKNPPVRTFSFHFPFTMSDNAATANIAALTVKAGPETQLTVALKMANHPLGFPTIVLITEPAKRPSKKLNRPVYHHLHRQPHQVVRPGMAAAKRMI